MVKLGSGKTLSMLVFVAIAVAALAAGVAAAPAYPGYTGMIFTPTESTLNMGATSLGAAFIGRDNNDTSYFSANFGLIEGLEAGLAVVDHEVGNSNTIVNAKYSVIKESFAKPGLAIGISDIGDDIDSTPYVVLGKSLELPGMTLKALRGHVGLGSGSLDGVFGGLSATISNTLTFMIEHDTNNLNLGLQLAVSSGLRAHADLIGGDDLGIGLSFNRGF
ncbi:MAG: hypothetical protein ACYC64_01050 [Armatimonadota bacterium]